MKAPTLPTDGRPGRVAGTRPRRLFGLRSRIAVVAVLTAIPLAVLVFSGAWTERAERRARAVDEVTRLAGLVATGSASVLDSARSTLRALADAPEVTGVREQECSRRLELVLARSPDLVNLGLADEQGIVRCSGVPGGAAVDVSDRSYFRRALGIDGFAIGDYIVGRITGKPSLPVALAIRLDGGRRGVLFASIDVNRLNEILASARLPDDASLLLVDSTSTVVARWPDPERWTGRMIGTEELGQGIAGPASPGTEMAGLDGVRHLYAVEPVGLDGPTGLQVAVGLAAASIEEAGTAEFALGLIVLFVALVIGTGAGLLVGDRTVSRPLARVTATTRLLEAGDLTARTEIGPGFGEISEVADAVDRMAAALADRTDRLEGAVADRTAELSAALDEAEDLYDNAPCGYHSLDAAGRFVRVNGTELRWLGYTRAELIGRPFVDLLTPESRATFDANFPVFKARGWVRDLEFDLVRKDGTTLPVSLSATAIRDADGRFVASRSTVDDRTERVAAAMALRAQAGFFRLSRDFFVALDGGLITHANEAWHAAVGTTGAESAPSHPEAYIHPDDVADYRSASERLVERGRVEGLVIRLRHVDGTYRWIDWSAERDAVTSVVFAVGRDVTDRVHIEAALRSSRAEAERAREAAEAADQAKSVFLSRMSHELRTPLNAILGFGQLLSMDDLTDEQRDSVDHIVRGGRHLLDLINEVLDISRIEAGELRLSREPVALGEVIDETASLIAPLADERGLTVHVEPVAGSAVVLADRQRLRQVLLNLLSNAVKYNRPDGSVLVNVVPRNGAWRIEIADQGPGISPERRERLFQPFDRLGAEATGIEGTGLGLALSRRLVDEMQGLLGMEDGVDGGSVFWFELPSSVAPIATVDRDDASDGEHMLGAGSILYIEDNPSNLCLMERVLERRPGIRLISAMLGRLGRELAIEHRPDLILLDLHLPDGPGEDVLASLRADQRTAHIPVVVLSADATPGQVERLRQAGARAYVRKPIDLDDLWSVIDEHLPVRGEE